MVADYPNAGLPGLLNKPNLFVYMVLQHFSADKPKPISKAIVNLVVILAIAGGILAYYWLDEHRLRKA